jgi:hypothetical protein
MLLQWPTLWSLARYKRVVGIDPASRRFKQVDESDNRIESSWEMRMFVLSECLGCLSRRTSGSPIRPNTTAHRKFNSHKSQLGSEVQQRGHSGHRAKMPKVQLNGAQRWFLVGTHEKFRFVRLSTAASLSHILSHSLFQTRYCKQCNLQCFAHGYMHALLRMALGWHVKFGPVNHPNCSRFLPGWANKTRWTQCFAQGYMHALLRTALGWHVKFGPVNHPNCSRFLPGWANKTRWTGN